MNLLELSEDAEAISRAYAEKFGIRRDNAYFLFKAQEEMGELVQACLMREGQARAKGLTGEQLQEKFADELADVLCHVLLIARHGGVDLDAAVARKWLVYGAGQDAA